MNESIKYYLWRTIFKVFIIPLICILITASSHAQYRHLMSNQKYNNPESKAKFSAGLTIGLPTGIGIDAAYGLTPNLNVRLGYNYAAYAVKGYDYAFSSTNSAGQKESQSFLIDASVELSHIQATVDYSPKPNGKFRFIGGVNIYPIHELSAGGTLKGVLKFNKVSITKDDLGSGTLTMGFYSRVSPFIGIGFGRTLPTKRLSLGLDLAATYKGNYKVDIFINEGIIRKTNEENADILENNLNNYWYQKIWPILNLRMGYRLQ
jgi:hypothetical protein